ncbi:hypothetical protein B0T13DRAFT_513581 [Neurospora crassa]|nr:hypothetical protein B0T13DRAFT_513581 [Neurospora crassa]
MTISSLLHTSRISDALLHTIYASDQEMYPAPLTYERLQSWRDACPELSICFNASNDGSEMPLGVIIVLPLVKKYWEDLLMGKIKEVDIDAGEMFAGVGGDGGGSSTKMESEMQLQAPVEVGLHVFHIERFTAWDAEDALKKTGAQPATVTVGGCEYGSMRFADMALEEIQRRVEAFNAEAGERRWDVLGFSALTATPAGKKTFARLGFVSTGYKEIFRLIETSSSSSPTSEVHSSGDDLRGSQNKAGPHTTVSAIYIYPGEARTEKLGSDVISESEMTVRYSATSSEKMSRVRW